MLLLLTYCLLAGALYFDLRERSVPNWLTAGSASIGLILQLALHGWQGVQSGTLGVIVGLALFLPLFALGKFGGGDVKLLMAIGMLRGAAFLFRSTLLGAVSGGIIAVLLLAWHRELSLVTLGAMTNSYRTQRTYPYSPAVAIGVLLADLGWLL